MKFEPELSVDTDVGLHFDVKMNELPYEQLWVRTHTHLVYLTSILSGYPGGSNLAKTEVVTFRMSVDPDGFHTVEGGDVLLGTQPMPVVLSEPVVGDSDSTFPQGL